MSRGDGEGQRARAGGAGRGGGSERDTGGRVAALEDNGGLCGLLCKTRAAVAAMNRDRRDEPRSPLRSLFLSFSLSLSTLLV